MTYTITAVGLSKYFGAIIALEDISFRIGKGETVGFADDNCAGKSTLMRSVSGDVIPSKDSLMIEGASPAGYPPKRASQLGMEMVYQDVALCDNLEIYGNLFLGKELARHSLPKLKVLDRKLMLRRAREILDRLQLSLPSLTELVSALSGAQRQLVAIARAIDRPDLYSATRQHCSRAFDPQTNETEILHAMAGVQQGDKEKSTN